LVSETAPCRFLYGFLLIVSCGALAAWAKAQYAMKTNGYFSYQQHAIFSVHLKILVLISFNSLVQGALIIWAVEANFEGWRLALAYGVGAGICEGTKGGITMLLLSAGIGRRSLQRAVRVGCVLGLLALAVVAFAHDTTSRTVAFSAGDVTSLGWEFAQLVFYSWVAFAPAGAVGFPRRPAAVAWASFWALCHALACAFMLMAEGFSGGGEDLESAGMCLQQGAQAVLQSVAKAWVIYRCFELEAKWWHGVDAGTGSWRELPCVAPVAHALGCGGSRKRGGHGSGGSVSSDGGGAEEAGSINSLFANIELTDSAAAAMSNALDTFGQSRGGAARFAFKRGSKEISSSSRGAPPSSDRRASSRDSWSALGGSVLARLKRPASGTGGPGSDRTGARPGQRRRLARVPLIDFTKLKILPSKLLGMGSSARVYEGRWCGNPCAVKVYV
jgi:hypothetical protein